MNIKEFVNNCEEFPTKAIYLLYFNLLNLKEYWDFISWSIDTSQDVLLSNPQFIDNEQEFVNIEDEDEAVKKFDELRGVFYNQLFVILFSYIEIFINKFTTEIYDAFFQEINKSNLSGTSYRLLKYLNKGKENIIHSNIPQKLRFIRNFVNWDNYYFKELKSRIKKYQIIRNSITHNEGKISERDKEYIPKEIINNNSIQLKKYYYEMFWDDLLNYCIEINNRVVENNPILKSVKK